jgi:translation elongation factor EF-Tu-like GTPase
MSEPMYGITLTVHVELLTPETGGRTRPIQSGYRPLCVTRKPDGTQVVIGLCELQLDKEIYPGDSGDGRLSFAVDVSEEVRSMVTVGARFQLAEGNHPIGSAEVRDIE